VAVCRVPSELVVANATLTAIVLPAYERNADLAADGMVIVYVREVPGLSWTACVPSVVGLPERVAESVAVPVQLVVPAAQLRPSEIVLLVAVTGPVTLAARGVVTAGVTVTVTARGVALVPSAAASVNASLPV
jgi:hypothetical protein